MRFQWTLRLRLLSLVIGVALPLAVMIVLNGIAEILNVASASPDVAYTKISSVLARNLLLSVAVVIVALLMARLIMRRIEPPLQDLIDAARAMSAGQDDVHVEPAPDRDLADLAIAFNQMVARRKEATAQLEQAAARYRELFENSRDALFVIDLQGRTIDANAAAKRLTGYSLDELRDSRVLDLMPIDAKESSAGRLTRYRQAQGTRELILVTHDGRQVPIEVAITPITYQGQTALLGAARDISERRQSEERLVRLSQRLLTLNEAGLRMQGTFDPDEILKIAGDELSRQRFTCLLAFFSDDQHTARVHYVSDPDWRTAFRDVTGADLIGFTFPVDSPTAQRIIHEQRTFEEENARALLEAGLPLHVRAAARDLFIRLRLTRVIIAPLVVERRTTAFFIVAGQDLQEVDTPAIAAFAHQAAITLENARLYKQVRAYTEELEQRVAERTRDLERAVAKAQEADKLKSQLLSIVSHELRTPLASIKGYVTTLIDYRDRLQTETQEEFLHIIDEESDRLRELVENVLDMSRIEAGVLRIHPEPAPLAPVIEDALTTLQPKLAGREVDVHLPDALPDVVIDAGRVRQVISNLIDNAAKYSPPGARIDISVAVDDGHVTVGVHDRGPGIAPEHAQKIFDRFYRIDDARIRTTGGIGLGLAISRALIEAHGGRLWLESQVGQGTTFYFSLPIAPGEPVAPATFEVSKTSKV